MMNDSRPLTELLRARLFGSPSTDLRNVGDVVVDELIRMALQRHDVDAIRLIFDRIDGPIGSQVMVIPGEWRETPPIDQ